MPPCRLRNRPFSRFAAKLKLVYCHSTWWRPSDSAGAWKVPLAGDVLQRAGRLRTTSTGTEHSPLSTFPATSASTLQPPHSVTAAGTSLPHTCARARVAIQEKQHCPLDFNTSVVDDMRNEWRRIQTLAEKDLGIGRMLAYPIMLEEDDGAILATSPDFPELTTFGDDQEEAVTRAVEALEEAIASRIHDRKEIPPPSLGTAYAKLPTLTSVKVMLYQGMRDQGITKAELARRLGWHLPQVDRVLDVQHRSWLDQMDAALGAIGWQLHVSAAVSPGSAVADIREYEAIGPAGTRTENRNGLGDSGEGIDRQ